MARCPSCHTESPDNITLCPACQNAFAGHLMMDRFRLVERLGRGGLGSVWLAEDVQLNNEHVACKILKPELYDDHRAVSDLKREVLLTRRLRHPNILGVYTFWETDCNRLITMEYVDGSNLSELLYCQRRPFAPCALVPWIQQLGDALDYAHGEGILHRDVKPANIMVDVQNKTLLADFGIARTAREVQARLSGELTSGTLLYVSPEQLMGEHLDARSDLYSLAATFYELMAGRPPFVSGSIITQIQMKPAPPVTGLPDAINEVLLKALAKDPARRHDSCGAFCQALTGAIAASDEVREPVQTELFSALDQACEEGVREATVALDRQDTAALKMRLGMLLIEDGLLTDAQLMQALEIQKVEGKRLGEILMAHLGLSETEIARTLSRQIQLPLLVPLPLEDIDPEVAWTITAGLARNRGCLPLKHGRGAVVVAMADPLDLRTLNELETTFGKTVHPVITTPTALETAISQLWPGEA